MGGVLEEVACTRFFSLPMMGGRLAPGPGPLKPCTPLRMKSRAPKASIHGAMRARVPPRRGLRTRRPPPFFFFFFSRRSEGAGRPEASERALAVNARRRGAGGGGLASPPTPSHSIASSPAEPAMRVAARARKTAAERMVCGWKNRGACVCACRSDASVSHAPACVRGSCALGTCNAGASKVRRKGGARLASAWEGESQHALTLCFVC